MYAIANAAPPGGRTSCKGCQGWTCSPQLTGLACRPHKWAVNLYSGVLTLQRGVDGRAAPGQSALQLLGSPATLLSLSARAMNAGEPRALAAGCSGSPSAALPWTRTPSCIHRCLRRCDGLPCAAGLSHMISQHTQFLAAVNALPHAVLRAVRSS